MNKTGYFFAMIFLTLTTFFGCSDSVSKSSDSDIEEQTNPQEMDNPCVPEGSFEATDYFWFDGKKILLQRIDNKFHIVFFSEDIDKLKSELEGTEAVLSNVGVCHSPNISSDRHTSSEITRATIEGYYNQIASALSHTIHWAPYFRMEDGTEIWLTNLFFIKLKSKTDLPLLEKLAMENSVVVIGELSFLPYWYQLACTLLSKGNALEMANLFYKTGLFANYSPGLIGTGYIDSIN